MDGPRAQPLQEITHCSMKGATQGLLSLCYHCFYKVSGLKKQQKNPQPASCQMLQRGPNAWKCFVFLLVSLEKHTGKLQMQRCKLQTCTRRLLADFLSPTAAFRLSRESGSVEKMCPVTDFVTSIFSLSLLELCA